MMGDHGMIKQQVSLRFLRSFGNTTYVFYA